jgi:hypothetical protein
MNPNRTVHLTQEDTGRMNAVVILLLANVIVLIGTIAFILIRVAQ